MSWLLDGCSQEISSPKAGEVQQLLNSTTAIVYWHLSPYALHTFIWKYDAPAPIVLGETGVSSAAARRLREFEDWLEEWNQKYEDYRRNKKDNADKSQHPWRNEMPQRLDKLKDILDISSITKQLSGVTQLILIPHRDLHRFPLHAFFLESMSEPPFPSREGG